MRPSGGVTEDQLRRAFADTVQVLRNRAGLSQEKLALAAGVSRGYMGRLEREANIPTLKIIYRLLPALGVSFAEFAAEFDQALHARKRPKP